MAGDQQRAIIDIADRQGKPLELPGAPIKGLKPGRATRRTGRDLWKSWGMAELRRPFGSDKAFLEAMRLIRDVDSMASQAIWNFLRLLNPGHEFKAYVFGADGSEKAEEGLAQLVLDDLVQRIGKEYGGGLDQFLNVLHLIQLTQGAIAAEVAPTEGLDEVEDWYAIDPALLAFQRIGVDAAGNPVDATPTLGDSTEATSTQLVLGQRWSNGTFHPLPPEQVFYMPLDPDVDDPYGRPPLVAALSDVLGIAQMINDLRQAVHVAGYPRVDIKVLWDVLKAVAPTDLQAAGKEKEFANWGQQRLNELVESMGSLESDDTFIHFDWIEVGGVQMPMGAQIDPEKVEKVLMHQLTSGLKHLPILLGLNEASSETHGSVQWQIFIAGVEALQHGSKRVIEKLGNTSLRIYGIAAHCKLTVKEIRKVDRLAEAQAEFIETKTRQIWVQGGLIDLDDMAMELTGSAATGEASDGFMGILPEPIVPEGETGGTGAQQPTGKEKQSAIDPLVLTMLTPTPAYSDTRSTRPGQQSGLSGRLSRAPELTGTRLESLASQFAGEAEQLFYDQIAQLVAALQGEGYELRDAGADLAEATFGLGYRRQMKGLLRRAVELGMYEAGQPFGEALVGRERLVRQIWKGNQEFLSRIKNDLAVQVRKWQSAAGSGRQIAFADVEGWFQSNAYRQEMMGQFLAKQGVAGGFTQRASLTGQMVFRWILGSSKQHCASCAPRDGQVFTQSDLERIGFPGSPHLECMSNCHCSISGSECGVAEAARTPAARLVAWQAPEQGKAAACSLVKAEAGAQPRDAFTEVKRPQDVLSDVVKNDPLDAGQRLAAKEWQGNGYRSVNKALYSDGFLGTSMAAQIDALDELTKAGSIRESLVVYRGINHRTTFELPDAVIDPDQAVTMGRLAGKEFRDDGFGSSSTSKSMAGTFGDTIMRIQMPAGTKALNVDAAAGAIGEAEVLLGRGAVFRIDGYDAFERWLNVSFVRYDPQVL